MATKKLLSAILFDVGDTLIYDEPSFIDTCVEFITVRNIVPDVDAMKQYILNKDSELQKNKLEADLYCDDGRIRALWSNYFGALIQAGAPELSTISKVLGGEVYDVYNPGKRWGIFPDVFTSLTQLKRLNFQLYVVSDWGSHLDEILRLLDLDKFFNDFYISTHIKLAKDSPKIYETTLERLSLKPSEVVMIGDSCMRDVVIPKSVGITSFLINRKQSDSNCNADLIFGDLATTTTYIIENYQPVR